MIYAGFQGIGKSTLARKMPNVVDLESSCFYIDGYDSGRPDGWYKIYATFAEHLSGQGKIVFVSTHKPLLDYMHEKNIEFTAVFPAKDLKAEWIDMLYERFESTNSFKDFRALAGAYNDFDESLDYLSKEKNKIIITAMDYSLENLIATSL